MQREVVLASRRETERLGARIARVLVPGDLVMLEGGLGAGKTVLAGAVTRSLGARDADVTSPTFSIVNEYAREGGGPPILHVDLYRLLDQPRSLDDEILRLGLRERRAEGAVLLVEWAEAGRAALGDDPALRVVLSIEGENRRRASISGERADEVA